MVADLLDRTRVVACGRAAVAGMVAEKMILGTEGVDDHLEPRGMRFIDQPTAAVRRIEIAERRTDGIGVRRDLAQSIGLHEIAVGRLRAGRDRVVGAFARASQQLQQ